MSSTMRPAFIAPPSEYCTDWDGAAGGDVQNATTHLNYEAARSQSQPQHQQQQQHNAKGQRGFFLNADAAAAPTNAAVAMDSATAANVDAALNDTMELFISSSTVEPAYELRGELGRGKYGRVFLVEDCVQHRLLAVKATFDPNWIATVCHEHTHARPQQNQPYTRCAMAAASTPSSRPTAEANDTLLMQPSTYVSNEVACLQECNSPFIVRLEAVEKGEHGEDLLLMEYVDCGDLRQEIRRRRGIAHPFTETEVAFIFLQLCMAVDHLHQRNILHHDLKPENVMLSSTGVVKLGDFGFAHKYAEAVCNRVACTGCGTPYYLSPEALRGERYSLKSEMWALGVILYELMALTGPFLAANRADLRNKVHEGQHAPLPSIYLADLRDVCAQLLQQDPDCRPSTQELFTQNEYLRGMLNELRRTSECSTKLTAEEKGRIFYSISAALRRRSPATPRGVATNSNCSSWGSSLHNSGGAAAQRIRVER